MAGVLIVVGMGLAFVGTAELLLGGAHFYAWIIGGVLLQAIAECFEPMERCDSGSGG